MSDEIRAEVGAYLLEDRGGIVFETSGNAAAELDALIADKTTPPTRAQFQNMLLRERATTNRLRAELAHVEQERDAALLAAEVATGTPCWRCGGAA